MPNQHTATPKDWDSAVIAYRDTPTPAVEIAQRIGCSLTYVYARMNRMNVAKFKAHPLVRVGPRGNGTRDTYRPAAVDSAEREDVSRRDAIVLAAHPRFRCGECYGLSSGPVCVCGSIINSYLAAV